MLRSKQTKLVGVILGLMAICVVVGHFAFTYAVDWALKGEARSLGKDWASHIETRIPELESMRDETGVVDPTKLPDAHEFQKLLADVTSVGHIYQFDFINSLCLCELSVGSFLSDPDNPLPLFVDHSGHDHTNPAHATSSPFQRRVKAELLDHVLQNNGFHEEQKLPTEATYQLPVDRLLAREVMDGGADTIIIRRDFVINQPTTFAEVYHPVVTDGELLYLLRVLVNLEGQDKLYKEILFIGALSGLLLLSMAFGYPAIRYLKLQKKQREVDKRVHFLAHHDVLTNLYNRNDFNEAVSDILWRCRERKTSALLFLFDLNNFKEVNDYHGHQAGDKLLCEFASALKKHVPQGGYIARFGGDEFVVVLDGIEEQDIRYQDYLDMPKSIQLLVAGSGENAMATIAGGVAQYPRDADDIGDLLQAADLALYAAKPNKAGEICEYNAEMKRDFFDRFEIREQFRLGLKSSQIEPYYQPIVCMETGKVEGLEALARWNHPERGVLTPFFFETIFDDSELSVRLGQQMLTKIVGDMREWKESGVPFERIGLNVLDSDLQYDGFAENIFSLLRANGLTSPELAIEVTENCLFCDNKARLTEVLEQLRQAGHPIALDDFGTGYSSITQLKELPITTVKIDKSFVDDVINNVADQSIISALLNLGNSMGFNLILEGIETIDQRDFLKEMGFNLAQGYYYARPMPASQVPAFIQRQEFGFDSVIFDAKAS